MHGFAGYVLAGITCKKRDHGSDVLGLSQPGEGDLRSKCLSLGLIQRLRHVSVNKAGRYTIDGN